MRRLVRTPHAVRQPSAKDGGRASVSATSSLAQSLCRALAKRGYGLVLMGRDEEETELLAGDVKTRYGAQCRVVIADLTGRNPNVFYEVGLAHAISKDVIMLTQSMEFVSFDLKTLRCITYEFTPRGMEKFEKSLAATIKAIVKTG